VIDPQILRASFNQAAREYDAVRPGYPPELIEDVIRLSAIPQGGRILEIGCGTGKATLPFARRGYEMLCLDIGPDLLAVAAENLREFPKVRFQKTAFEDWPEQPEYFDLIIAATAFHWVPPETGYPKSARALKPGGSLAIFLNEHPRPSSGFFEEVNAVYRQVSPVMGRPAARPNTEEVIGQRQAEVLATGLFSSVTVRTYPWTATYSTRDYIRLLNTYSDHLTLDEDRRRTLYQGIASLIDERYGGKVEKEYLAVLYLAKK